MSTCLASLIVSVGLLAAPDAKDRPVVAARIYDQPIHLTLDAGSSRFIVFARVADRIGLKYRGAHGFDPNRTRPGHVPLFCSEACTAQVENPEGPPAFTKPAGTKVNLTVLREGQPIEVTVMLKELLPVEADKWGKGMS